MSTSISITGDAYANVSYLSGSPPPVVGEKFSCSSMAASGGNAGCSTNPIFYSADGGGASLTITAFGSVEASDGSIEFSGRLSALPIEAFSWYSDFTETASASYSYLLSFEGTEPSSIQLSFLPYNYPSDSAYGDATQLYSITLGDDPTVSLNPGYPVFGPTTFTETFPVDPTAGSALLTVQGINSGDVANEGQLIASISAGLTLQSVEFLDANGNLIAIAEPSEMIPLGAGLLTLFWARCLRTRKLY